MCKEKNYNCILTLVIYLVLRQTFQDDILRKSGELQKADKTEDTVFWIMGDSRILCSVQKVRFKMDVRSWLPGRPCSTVHTVHTQSQSLCHFPVRKETNRWVSAYFTYEYLHLWQSSGSSVHIILRCTFDCTAHAAVVPCVFSEWGPSLSKPR